MSAAAQLALFELPTQAPTRPRPGTLAERGLEMLLDGRAIDHPTFELETGSWRLAAVVFELRALGWPVQTTEHLAPSRDCPGRAIALYSLSARALADLLAVCGRPQQ